MRCRVCDGLLPEHRPYVVWHTDCEGNQILKEHRIWPPEREPSNGQVECAVETGYFLSAHPTFSYGNLKA